MDGIKPVYPSSFEDPEPPPDPLADHRKTIIEAGKCPCWKCQQRLVCRYDCERFKQYVHGAK